MPSLCLDCYRLNYTVNHTKHRKFGDETMRNGVEMESVHSDVGETATNVVKWWIVHGYRIVVKHTLSA